MKTQKENYRPSHNGLKSKIINLRTSESEKEILHRASERLSQSTGEKQNISKTIIEAVKQFEPPYFVNNYLLKQICSLHTISLPCFSGIASDFKLLNFGNITIEDFENILGSNFKDIEQRFYGEIRKNIARLGIENETICNNLIAGTEAPLLEFKNRTLKNLEDINYNRRPTPDNVHNYLSIQNYTLIDGDVLFTDLDKQRIQEKYCTINLDTPIKSQVVKITDEILKGVDELKIILSRNNIRTIFGYGEVFEICDIDGENGIEQTVFFNRQILNLINK
ncbi:MAG: hypothetical protein WCS03_09445 [Bacteroidota bacterium]